MTAITPTTELEAVNVMLSGIGESPVASLADLQLGDALLALRILRQTTREAQARGWQFNREFDYPFPADPDGTVVIPDDVLKFRVSDSQAGSLDGVWRAGKVYDRYNHTFTIGATVRGDVTFALPFEDCPQPFRWYVTIRATRIFSDRAVGSNELHGFTAADEKDAEETLMHAEGDTATPNILTDNSAVFGVLARSGRFGGGSGGRSGSGLAGNTNVTVQTGRPGPQGIPGNNDFPVGFYCEDYLADEVLFTWVATVAAQLPALCSGSVGLIGDNPTAQVAIALEHYTGGSWAALGDILLNINGSITWPGVDATTIAAGEGLRFVAPSGDVDLTLANFTLALKLTKVT